MCQGHTSVSLQMAPFFERSPRVRTGSYLKGEEGNFVPNDQDLLFTC